MAVKAQLTLKVVCKFRRGGGYYSTKKTRVDFFFSFHLTLEVFSTWIRVCVWIRLFPHLLGFALCIISPSLNFSPSTEQNGSALLLTVCEHLHLLPFSEVDQQGRSMGVLTSSTLPSPFTRPSVWHLRGIYLYVVRGTSAPRNSCPLRASACDLRVSADVISEGLG